ncbi:hypothetical protein [Bradyrhizobium sp. USDA 3364]
MSSIAAINAAVLETCLSVVPDGRKDPSAVGIEKCGLLVLLDLLALGPKQLSETASLNRIDQKVAGRFVLGAAFGFDDRKLQHAEDAILRRELRLQPFEFGILRAFLGDFFSLPRGTITTGCGGGLGSVIFLLKAEFVRDKKPP